MYQTYQNQENKDEKSIISAGIGGKRKIKNISTLEQIYDNKSMI